MNFLEYIASLFLCLWKTLLTATAITVLLVLFFYQQGVFNSLTYKKKSEIYYSGFYDNKHYFIMSNALVEKELKNCKLYKLQYGK